jgi:hypothetical protein
MRALLVLVAAAENAYWPEGVPFDYQISYARVPSTGVREDGRDPADAINIGYSTALYDEGGTMTPVAMHQCTFKCAGKGECFGKNDARSVAYPAGGDTMYNAPCFCDGYCARSTTTGEEASYCPVIDGLNYETEELDLMSSKAVCADEPLCRKLCDAEPGCYGIQMSIYSKKNRCYLLYEESHEKLLKGSLTANTAWDFLARMDVEEQGFQKAGICPRGVVVVGAGMDAELDDTYGMMNDGLYEVTGGPRVRWHESGCGFVVEKEFAVTTKPVAPVPAMCAGCADMDVEIGWIFGMDHVTCEVTEPWLDTPGYCGNALFAALCPLTCGCEDCSVGDKPAAVSVLTEMLDIADGCASLKAEKYMVEGVVEDACDDPIVSVVCASSCGARRLLRSVLPHVQKRTVPMRRLSTYWSVIYQTWNPVELPSWCSDSKPADTSIIAPAIGLYDMVSFYDEVMDGATAMTLGRECLPNPVYRTFDGDCHHSHHLDPVALGVQEHMCYAKCLADGTYEASKVLGPPGYCEGMDPTYDYDSSALCLPREDCEALCDSLDDCGGIEMHILLPRCYLVGKGCNPGNLKPSSQYEFATTMSLPVTFQTFTRRPCTAGFGGAMSTTALAKVLSNAKSAEEAAAVEFIISRVCTQYCAPRKGNEHKKECVDEYYKNYDRNSFCMTRHEAEEALEKVEGLVGFKQLKGYNIHLILEDSGDNCGDAPEFCPETNKGKAATCLGDYEFPEEGDKNAMQKTFDFVAKLGYPLYETSKWDPPCYGVVKGSGSPLVGKYDLYAGESEACAFEYELPKGETYPACYVLAKAGVPSSRLVYADLPVFDNPDLGVAKRCSGYIVQEYGANGWTSKLATFADGDCPSGEQGIPDPEVPLYLYAPLKDADARLDYTCAGYSSCPTLSTCVLSKNRHAAELATHKAGIEEYGFVFYAEDAVKAEVLNPVNYAPKTIITVDRADMFLAKSKLPFAGELYRNVPDHTRVMVKTLPPTATMAILSLFSSALDSSTGLTDLGVEYVVPDGYEPWLLDVIRIETFSKTTVLDGPLTLDVYAPGDAPMLSIFRFEPVKEVYVLRSKKLEYERMVDASKITPKGDGWFRVVLPVATGDYLVTTVTPCGDLPTIKNLDADPSCPGTMVGDSYLYADGTVCPFVCKPGYRPCAPGSKETPCEAGELKCTLGSWNKPVCVEDPYVEERHYFRVEARGRLDYGWRIREIYAVEEESCSLSARALGLKVEATSGNYVGGHVTGNSGATYTFGSQQLNDGEVLKDEIGCTNLQTCKDWWSSELHANPYAVDETHDTVFFEFSIAGDVKLGCINFVMRSMTNTGEERQYFPNSAVVYRGFIRTDFPDDKSSNSKLAVDGWTEMWKVSMDDSSTFSKKAEGAVFSVKPSCGLPGHAVGEIIHYEPTVPSSCHCQQLCVDMVEEGCAAWRFSSLTYECFIQGPTVMFTEGCEGPFISGEPGLRVKSVKLVGTTLSVEGFGFPHKLSRSGPEASRQRIKVIAGAGMSAEACASARNAPTVAGLACVSEQICAPAPAATSSKGASWTGVTIAPGPTGADYTVCFHTGEALDRYAWHPVGDLNVPAAGYTFTTDEISATSTAFKVSVMRPAFSVGPLPHHWGLKIVKKSSAPGYDCRVSTDASFTVEADLPAVDKSSKVSSSLSLSLGAEDLAVIRSAPDTAKVALAEGIAGGLGLSADRVTVTALVFDDGTRVDFSRRLAGSGCTVEFEVFGDDSGDVTAVTTALTSLAGGAGAADLVKSINEVTTEYFPEFQGSSGVTVETPTIFETWSTYEMEVYMGNLTVLFAKYPDNPPANSTTFGSPAGLMQYAIASYLGLDSAEVIVPTANVSAVQHLLGRRLNVSHDNYALELTVGLDTVTVKFSVLTKPTVSDMILKDTEKFSSALEVVFHELLSNTTSAVKIVSVEAADVYAKEPERRLVDEDVLAFNVTVGAGAAGDYLVCFTDSTEAYSPIPDSKGAQVLTMPELALRKDRKVFGGQRLSARSGEIVQLSVAGSRLPLSTFGKLAVVNGTCGAPDAPGPCTVRRLSAVRRLSNETNGTNMTNGSAVVSASAVLTLTEASLTAMLADKTSALAGLKNGLQESLGADVTIIATDPDLLARRLAARRLAATASLTVDFDVAADAAGLADVLAADSAALDDLASSVTTALETEGLTVVITGTRVSAGVCDPDISAVLGSGSAVEKSTSAYTFEMTIGTNETAAGTYSLCYCEDTDSVTAGSYCESDTAVTHTSPDKCSTKCDRGCTGSGCYCDSYLEMLGVDADAAAEAICLPADDCLTLCTDTAGCSGINVVGDYPNTCWLAHSSCDMVSDPPWDFLSTTGGACASSEDYKLDVGTVAVTGRPHLTGDWVLTPGKEQSVEVVGTGLEPLRDRLYITWATGVCGVSDPVGGTMEFYAKNVPVFDQHDPPSKDLEGGYVEPKIPTAKYRSEEKAYCAGMTKVDLSELPADDLCYNKCAVKSNTDENCAGLLAGYDKASNGAFCLAKDECVDLCTVTPSCYGVTMHRSLPRCFLHTNKCQSAVEASELTPITEYDFIYKVDSARRLSRRLNAARRLTAVSSSGLLRFAGVSLDAGRYKACFCDYEIAGVCKTLADFPLEVGEVHVSGVSCLLEDAKYTKGVCVSQPFGGLRCYDSAAPDIPDDPEMEIPAVASTILPKPVAAGPTVEESTWCLYGPEEDTSVHPICDFVLPAED